MSIKKSPKSNVFPERIKYLRGTRCKADFARYLGFPAPVYQRYEEGRIPSATNRNSSRQMQTGGRCGMTFLDLCIDIIVTLAGWAAIILGLAWAGRHFIKRETHIYLPPVGGGDGGGGRGTRPAPRSPGGNRRANKKARGL